MDQELITLLLEWAKSHNYTTAYIAISILWGVFAGGMQRWKYEAPNNDWWKCVITAIVNALVFPVSAGKAAYEYKTAFKKEVAPPIDEN